MNNSIYSDFIPNTAEICSELTRIGEMHEIEKIEPLSSGELVQFYEEAFKDARDKLTKMIDDIVDTKPEIDLDKLTDIELLQEYEKEYTKLFTYRFYKKIQYYGQYDIQMKHLLPIGDRASFLKIRDETKAFCHLTKQESATRIAIKKRFTRIVKEIRENYPQFIIEYYKDMFKRVIKVKLHTTSISGIISNPKAIYNIFNDITEYMMTLFADPIDYHFVEIIIKLGYLNIISKPEVIRYFLLKVEAAAKNKQS